MAKRMISSELRCIASMLNGRVSARDPLGLSEMYALRAALYSLADRVAVMEDRPIPTHKRHSVDLRLITGDLKS